MKPSSPSNAVFIIGSGPAGLTAALYTARAGLQPIVCEGPTPGGQLMGTSLVENWPGTPSILGPELMLNMRAHAAHYGAQFIDGSVTKLDLSNRPFTIWVDEHTQYQSLALIIATGATPRRLNCPGEAQYWGKGVTTCAVCDGALYRDKQVIIVGGGDTALEDATFMTRFTDSITIVHIRDALSASQPMQQRLRGHPSIKVRYNATVTQIQGDGSKVTHAVITDQQSGETQLVEVDALFIAIGLTPNTALIKGQIACAPNGYILHEAGSSLTSVEGVFVAGDNSDYRYRQAITAAGEGCRAAIDAERFLASKS